MARKTPSKSGGGKGRSRSRAAGTSDAEKVVQQQKLSKSVGDRISQVDAERAEKELTQAQAGNRDAMEEAAADMTAAEMASRYPQGRPREGGGVRRGLVARDLGSDEFPDLMRKLVVRPARLDTTPGVRIFHSKYLRHKMQMTCPPPEYDAAGRRIDMRGETIEFEPRDDLGVGEVRLDEVDDAEKVAYIEGRGQRGDANFYTPCLGWGTIIWDAHEKQKVEARVMVQNLKTLMSSDPELVDVLRGEIADEDMVILDALTRKSKAGNGAGDRHGPAGESG